MARITASHIFLFNIVVLAFMYFNFNPNLAGIYALLALANYVLFKTDSFPTVFIEKTPNRMKSLALAFGGIFVFAILSTIVLQFTGLLSNIGATFGLSSVIELYAETIPFFAQSAILTFIAFGLIIPIIETDFFFGTGLEAIKDILGLRFNLRSISTWALFVIISVVFILFHLSAKNISTGATAQLVLVGLFAMISLVIVLVEGQTLGAILFHVFANSIALLDKLGIYSSSYQIFILGGIGLLFLFITKQFKVVSIGGRA